MYAHDMTIASSCRQHIPRPVLSVLTAWSCMWIRGLQLLTICFLTRVQQAVPRHRPDTTVQNNTAEASGPCASKGHSVTLRTHIVDLIVMVQRHKAKATGLASRGVAHHTRLLHLAKLVELVLQLLKAEQLRV